LITTSSYTSGAVGFNFTEIHFHSHGEAYLEYRLTFPETRNPLSNFLQFAEIEIPGMLLPADPSASPTKSPSISPTMSPTTGPTVSFEVTKGNLFSFIHSSSIVL